MPRLNLNYKDHSVLRALLTEINSNEQVEDRLSEDESLVLGKINQIIANMEQARRDEHAGVRSRNRWRERRKVRVMQ